MACLTDEDKGGFKDEKGRLPGQLGRVKQEEAPGPRNEIVMNPRISHVQYHAHSPLPGDTTQFSILTVSPDGEREYPPGQTPVVSRSPSIQRDEYEKAIGRTVSEGEWTDALRVGGGDRTSRWSSFRDSKNIHDHDSEYHSDADAHEHAQNKWSLLRSRVLPHRSSTGPNPTPGKVTALAPTAVASVPIATELFAGQLPVMMLKTWLDRDEDGHRAVPVLLGSLRFRVGDSVGLKPGNQTGKEMFKIECEYGDGAVKWVIFRELRDFVSLHAHYKASNFGSKVTGLRSSRGVEIPDFPKMSIPYLNRLGWEKSEKGEKWGRAEYAEASRGALQKYLVELIRAVIFRPESNRLCKFFELSALTVSLAPRGGFQGKAGFLRLPGSNTSRRANQPGLTPTSWIHNRSPKWFIVRDSYFVATDGPESLELYDVFLIDSDFAIERPKRVYRTGFNLLSGRNLKKGKLHDPTSDAGAIDHVDTENPHDQDIIAASGEGKGPRAEEMKDERENDASQHTFFIVNSQRKLKLVTRNARQMHQFIVSMERIAAQCVWSGRNRFDSFAPLRINVAAQWLVDGRDYFWNLSRAMNMAKDRIYIHDWWISPELYLRRPGDERYRLDNLLKRKAEEGVKIFIIIYNEVSDKTTPVDSLYAKRTLSSLHPNILVQRSPSHFQTGTFYWSHHEKLCVIDETIAFMGGLDLCYGRWDTSQHVLTDEDHSSQEGPDGPVWRGKDYSNERVMEYSNLDKPFEDMFDRTSVPRMPWHDVGLQLVGHPARDLCRHFVQRWNLLIRTKNHKRQMPFLLPPPDFTDRELGDLQLQGTCEVQICRSVGPWSMSTLTKIEHSIQNAYCKSIELSEHFVYIENQFFITSTVVDGVRIQNGIGDALVERAIRAHREGTKWRACIVIPLLPGYTFPIDSDKASSVRLILECQNRTISRGTHSIFSRLRKEGIDPDEYITFFSLRGWAKFKSGTLTTEQVYIHGKTMIVDDRLVLCGSANINERSQRGDRDSELVAVVRDTDMVDSTMGGKPFKVGRFAHTLRMRLMREHVGVDVDSIEEDQLMSRKPIAEDEDIETWDPDHEQEDEDITRGITTVKRRTAKDRLARTFETGVSSLTKGVSERVAAEVRQGANKIIHPLSAAVKGQTARSSAGAAEEREDTDENGLHEGFASSVVPTLEEKTIMERRPSARHANGTPLFDLIEEGQAGSPPPEAKVPEGAKKDETVDGEGNESGVPRVRSDDEGDVFGTPAKVEGTGGSDESQKDSEDADEDLENGKGGQVDARRTLRRHLEAKVTSSPWSMPTPTPKINPNRLHDPLEETFWKDMWVAVAVHNTEIYRKVFRCVPDDLVTSWAAYKAFASHAEKFNRRPEDVAGPGHAEPVKVVHDGPGTHGAGGGGSGGGHVGEEGQGGEPSEVVGGDVGGREKDPAATSGGDEERRGSDTSHADPGREPSGPDDAWNEWEVKEMEELLNEVRGHLVIYPTRFLEAEDLANNFLFNVSPSCVRKQFIDMVV
ncbi:hypothetical protein TREMEDRAFT_34686 [Tremella mesenterica DSM 1558]|uniref:uncharacterized protein n=1 Tax=Tremella mesenterica (strain ATCC 24925 / CBS 8224 / DSM 1558 / NBRC 9311 / NRRL Y-6157 / RJB 2259-6 / UBC 559-6) TaxID=578456 RepID=UPI00032BF646|nr:uncharacterized protein TREMEDRAFT_34686 [Tremella mesenterica DSM 1558]EIW66666.1 hypothetical protein TREMEDRAFT_34686 [Tremella mesenterica DSM 1558]